MCIRDRSYRQGAYEERFEIDGGYAEISPDSVLVFTETAAADSSADGAE